MISQDADEKQKPLNRAPVFTRILKTDSGVLYGTAKNRGFFVSTNGRDWIPKNNGLPKRVVYPFTGNEIETLTSICFDPIHEQRVAVTTAYGLFVSEDSGDSWNRIKLAAPLKPVNYLTSAAFSQVDKNKILIGTSFGGLFETNNRGSEWKNISDNIPIYRGAGFYKEVSGIVYSPEQDGVILIHCGMDNSFYKSAPDRSKWIEIEPPVNNNVINSLLVNEKVSLEEPPEKIERINKASDRYGIFINSFKAGGKALEDHISFIKANGLNSFVVDVKDDTGIITYNTNLELPVKTGAVRKRVDIANLIQTAHDNSIYVIGRIVVFKDKQFYNYDSNRYALWDSAANEPWGNKLEVVDKETGETTLEQKEFWVDPFCEEVWQYNIKIARELQDLGIDEIQFDYIRFPSDGDISTIKFRYRKKGMTRSCALESFLRAARENIHIPISTDLYGFNSWYRMGNWIGQNIEMLADYVDVICPMFYPSHFPRDFINDIPYLDRAKQIYYEGTKRASQITGSRSIIRPYIQAFLIGKELNMEEPEYTQYLIEQIEGTINSESSGFTLWNMSNRYYMVTVPLTEYVKTRENDFLK